MGKGGPPNTQPLVEKTSFPLEKILKTKTEVWLASQNKSLDDFEMFGVHCTGHYDVNGEKTPIEFFAEKIPDNASIVTDYDFQTHPNRGYSKEFFNIYGLALIPKKG